MAEQQDPRPEQDEQLPAEVQDAPARPEPQNALQKFYELFRGVPLRYIDAFIVLCVAAFAAVILLGMLKGRGIL